ncbi:4-hydroxyphenylacetate isomerase [Peribacillus cavernae]|uniref:4-hydroxyphenylacetate isomerase n=1 Tax=Peribacillus cavernae TaxID=1674310 RepID=A0A433HRP5_9BACI|nr:fumarylacetoacetate hydrolase family protein [Peribacillus cavernae]MDQ0218682.1 5-oxopent-3-ene-1,2,5-tricarboxylate decarboxylase/2-hydroxyhepta-2,4-diene-1,7-dioate isomerase [Peribacillus cavernae]RUQ30903.1 4-hydroxyphenylacetate isomerase [Peribacillus cavernae]
MFKAKIRLQGRHQIEETSVDLQDSIVNIHDTKIQLQHLRCDPPVSGTIYGVLLNYKGALEALGDLVNEPPYNQPPVAPILYIKPVNTIIGHGSAIPLPAAIEKLEMGAALGIVIGKTATKVSIDEAIHYIAGYTVVNDVSVPHKSVFRPVVKHRSRDGFCPVGPWIIEKDDVKNPNDLTIRVFINGKLVQENNTSNLIRPVEELIRDVSEFMTLFPGDVLLVGVPEASPVVGNGDHVRIEIDGVGFLENTILPENDVYSGGFSG